MTRLTFTVVGAALAAVSLSIAASRVARSQVAQPGEPAVLATSYLPPDASFAVLIRPAALAAKETSQRVVDAVDVLLKPAKLGISVADIDECKFVMLGDLPGPDGYLVARARRAVDWKTPSGVAAAVAAGNVEQEKVGGHTLYSLRSRTTIWLPDERTVVAGSRDAIEQLLKNSDPNDRAQWWGHWQPAAKSQLAVFLQPRMFGLMELPGADGQPDKSLAALEKDIRFAILAANLTDKGLAVRATMLMKSNAGAVRAAPVVARGLTNLASLIARLSEIPPDDADRLTEQLTILVESTRIETQGKTLEITGLVTPKMLEVFATSARLMGER